jgi:HD superfamily phosphohydrolase
MGIHRFLDPIHGNIELELDIKEDRLILDLIETREFQRLRRIRQLGFSYLTFYGAENTRFVHSIGCFAIARKVLDHLQNTSQYQKILQKMRLPILIAALLHDIGHGPFSHSSEPAFLFKHEIWTIKNILGKTEINQCLQNHDPRLAKQVTEILKPQPGLEASWASQLISGQLDCDRADYLLRDSRQTGTTYGVFQLERIIQSLVLGESQGKISLLVQEKGLQAVEDYLFARYSMYLQVYHHKTTLGADTLFVSLMQRARDLKEANYPLRISEALNQWLNGKPLDLKCFWEVDDMHIFEHLKAWQNEPDQILADLADRLLNRRLFKAVKAKEFPKRAQQKIRKNLGEKAAYYFVERQCREFPYNERRQPVLITRSNGKIKELSKISGIAKALLNKDKELDIDWIFYPKEYSA